MNNLKAKWFEYRIRLIAWIIPRNCYLVINCPEQSSSIIPLHASLN
jgi:hypothetical protein